uniref:Sulfotransferase n=1 Tax=Ciona savignyi TaxID=51511 RepID=H2Z3R4_CIOSA
MIRNPKDQAVSWCHFASGIQRNSDAYKEMYPKDWNKFLRSYIAGEQFVSTKPGEWYPDHILSWYKHRGDGNVMFVYYEDLIKDFKSTVQRIAKFVNTNLLDDEIERIANETSFASMKIQAQPREIGDWKNHFTVAQSEQMDSLIANKLARTDINFVYEL